MGYHERSFDLFLPYSLDSDLIDITENDYLAFFLDAIEHPEHYDGKRICFTDPIEVRRDGMPRVGRVVMTCCMADLQFMSFPLTEDQETEGWVTLEAKGYKMSDGRLSLIPMKVTPSAPSSTPILSTQTPR